MDWQLEVFGAPHLASFEADRRHPASSNMPRCLQQLVPALHLVQVRRAVKYLAPFHYLPALHLLDYRLHCLHLQVVRARH